MDPALPQVDDMKVSAVLTRSLPVFCLLLFVVASFIGAFTGGIWASLGIGGALVMAGAVWGVERKFPQPAKDSLFFVLVALGAMALLNLCSSQPAISWHKWGLLVTIFLPLLLLTSPRVRAHAFPLEQMDILFFAAASGALALGVELSLGGPLLLAVKKGHAYLTEYNRGLSYLVVLAFAIMAGLRMQGRLILTAALVCLLLFPAGLTESRAAKLALLMGLGVTFVAHFLPVITRRVLMGLPVVLIAWPFAVQKFFMTHYQALQHLPDSWRARMEIWDYMSYRLMERPWGGWGLGTSHILPFENPHGAQYVFTTVAAPHPHNVVTQLWVELGLPGLVLGIVFAILMLRKAGQLDVRLMPYALGAWMAALCLSLVAYDFWTDSLFAAFALTGFLFAILNQKPTDKQLEAV